MVCRGFPVLPDSALQRGFAAIRVWTGEEKLDRIFESYNFVPFRISVGGQEVLVAAPAFTSNSIQVLPHPDFLRPPSSPGIKSAIPSITESDSLLGAWAATLQCLLNPLWFPIACSCLLPVIAFLVLTRDFAVKSDCDGDRPNSLSEKCKLLEVGHCVDTYNQQNILLSNVKSCWAILYLERRKASKFLTISAQFPPPRRPSRHLLHHLYLRSPFRRRSRFRHFQLLARDEAHRRRRRGRFGASLRLPPLDQSVRIGAQKRFSGPLLAFGRRCGKM